MGIASINSTPILNLTTSVAEPLEVVAALPATPEYAPQTSSYFGPTGSVTQGDATYAVTNGEVWFNGKAIGSVNDAGDYSVVLNGQQLTGNVGNLIGAAIEGTTSTGAKVDLQPTAPTAPGASAIPGITDDQIRAFYATNPSQDAIDAIARKLGLNNTQIMRATEIGTGIDFKTAPAWQVLGAYEQANHLTRTYARQTDDGRGERQASFYAPKLGREVTPEEIASFYAKRPTRSQVLAKAAELGISAVAIPDTSAFGPGSDSTANAAQQMSMGLSLNRGTDGYASNSAGQVVSVKDPDAMYSSDPLHTGLDRYFNRRPESGSNVGSRPRR